MGVSGASLLMARNVKGKKNSGRKKILLAARNFEIRTGQEFFFPLQVWNEPDVSVLSKLYFGDNG